MSRNKDLKLIDDPSCRLIDPEKLVYDILENGRFTGRYVIIGDEFLNYTNDELFIYLKKIGINSYSFEIFKSYKVGVIIFYIYSTTDEFKSKGGIFPDNIMSLEKFIINLIKDKLEI